MHHYHVILWVSSRRELSVSILVKVLEIVRVRVLKRGACNNTQDQFGFRSPLNNLLQIPSAHLQWGLQAYLCFVQKP